MDAQRIAVDAIVALTDCDREVVVTFTKAGRYSFLCGIADHATRGMKGSITVS